MVRLLFSLCFEYFLIFVPTAVRVEWAKAKARAERWTEEVLLVNEEMRRTIAYCRWQSAWWKSQVGERQNISPELVDGMAAYAFEHADLEERFALDLERRWDVIRRRAREFIESGFSVDIAEVVGERVVGDGQGGDPTQAPETVTLNLCELDALDYSDEED